MPTMKGGPRQFLGIRRAITGTPASSPIRGGHRDVWLARPILPRLYLGGQRRNTLILCTAVPTPALVVDVMLCRVVSVPPFEEEGGHQGSLL
jgi:hypothetical protein